jgi:hypothetical protein
MPENPATVAEAVRELSSSKLIAFERCPERCRRLYCRGPREHSHSVYQAAGAILDARVKDYLREHMKLPCPPYEELAGWVSPLQARGISLGGQLWEGYKRTGALAQLAREVVAIEPARLLPGGEPDPEDDRGGWRVRGSFEGRPLTMRPDALIDSGFGEGPDQRVDVSWHEGPREGEDVPDMLGRIATEPPEAATRLAFDCVHDWKTSGVVRGASPQPWFLKRFVGGIDVGFHRDLGGLVKQAAVDWSGQAIPPEKRDPYLISIDDLPEAWQTQLGLYALGLGVRRVAVSLVYARPGWRSVECAEYRARVSGGFEDKLRARVSRFWAWADSTPAGVELKVPASRGVCWAYNSACEVGRDCSNRLEAGISG